MNWLNIHSTLDVGHRPHQLAVWSTDHNILMLSVRHEGVGIPLLWWMLDKPGNSNTEERILLISSRAEIFTH